MCVGTAKVVFSPNLKLEVEAELARDVKSTLSGTLAQHNTHSV
jgi:hypothetical protein